jgi:hypothetical protein
MSEYWGFICLDDGSETETALNHGENQLRQIVRAWPAIAAVMETEGYGDGFEISSMWPFAPWGWLTEHAGHRIALLSEYGDTEAVDATDPTVGFQYHFTVTGAQRRAIQAALRLDHLPDGGEVKRHLTPFLQDAIAQWLALHKEK